MTKHETNIMKGVAIMLMLFLHLFNQTPYESLYEDIFYLGDTSFVYLLSRACNPVAFFLMLGGYGMYYVYQKGDKNKYIRILKLYTHYWVILSIFLIIGYFIFDKQIGSFGTLISNITGFKTTYNAEIWFLLPYVLLSVSSSWLFSFTDRFKTKYVLGIQLFIYLCTSFLISKYGESFIYKNNWIYVPLLYFHLMFPFYLGAMSVKHQIFQKISANDFTKKIKPFGFLILILLIALRVILKTGALHTFYAYAFIIIFLNSKRLSFFDKVLSFLGKHSMNMWMIHSWFCYYLFKDFIYGFKYPILIYIILLAISLCCSILINFICTPLEKLINRIFYIKDVMPSVR